MCTKDNVAASFFDKQVLRMIKVMKQRMVSIKIDGASRGKSHIFLIYAQYMIDGIVKGRTLAAVELTPTGVLIEAKMGEVMKEYKIGRVQESEGKSHPLPAKTLRQLVASTNDGDDLLITLIENPVDQQPTG
jgi:hypothetical protein